MPKAKTRKFRTLDQHIDFGSGRIIAPDTEVEVKVRDKDALAIWEHLVRNKAAVEIEMLKDAEVPDDLAKPAEKSEGSSEEPDVFAELAEESEPPEEPDDAEEIAEEYQPSEEPDDAD